MCYRYILLIYQDDKEKKTTFEKPVPLPPLNFKKALKGLLKVKLKEDVKGIEEKED